MTQKPRPVFYTYWMPVLLVLFGNLVGILSYQYEVLSFRRYSWSSDSVFGESIHQFHRFLGQWYGPFFDNYGNRWGLVFLPILVAIGFGLGWFADRIMTDPETSPEEDLTTSGEGPDPQD